MKNVVLLRKEAFGGTLFNSTTGKRIYINKQEYKELLTNNDLIYELGIIINALNSYRYKLKSLNEPRSEVNELLLRLLDDSEREKNSKKKLIKIYKKDR